MTDNYTEELGYVDIHGKDVRVFISEKTGTILVPIDELKRVGFRIYRKTQYSRLLVEEKQFSHEFDLYILQAAQSYLLENKIMFDHDDILESINKCKQALSGKAQNASNKSPEKFTDNHVVEKSCNGNFSITTSLRQPNPATLQSLQNDRKFGGFAQKTPDSVMSSIEKSLNLDSESKQRQSFHVDRTQQKQDAENVKPRQSFNNDRSQQRNDTENSKPRNFTNNFEQRKGFEQNSFDKNNSLSPKASHESMGKPFPGRKSVNFNHNTNDRKDGDGNSEPVEKMPSIELNQPEHKVMVTSVENSKYFWVQDIANANQLLEIDELVKAEAATAPSISSRQVVYGKVYLAQHEGDWFRCRAIKFKPTVQVIFLDYGNIEQATEFKEVSDKLAAIPIQAVKVTITNTEPQRKVELYETLKLKVIKKMDKYFTYIISILEDNEPPPPKKEEKPPTPPQPAIKTFSIKPKPLCHLEHGQKVMIVNHSYGKLVLRTKECYEKLKQIERALAEIQPDPVNKVEEGQLVLYKKDKLQRAMVLSVQGVAIEIELIDHFDNMKVHQSDLYHINEALAHEPLTYILSPQVKGYSTSADAIIKDLVAKMVKGTVVFSNGNFDIKIDNNTLSDKLKPQQPKSNHPTLKDFKSVTPSLGVGEFMLNAYCDPKHVYFGSPDELETYLEQVLKCELPGNSYEPVEGEVCFGYYQESWCRCVVKRVMSSRFEVQFIDFGNVEMLNSEQLRKLSDDAKKAPILGIHCELTGLPKDKNVEESLTNLLVDGSSYEVNIKKFNGTAYEIEIPSVYGKF